MPNSADNPRGKPIRALLDAIEKTPTGLYGQGRARWLRRLVHITLAKHADADGSNIYASLARIAYLCLASERSVQEALSHLIAVGLVRKLDKRHEFLGTTQYQLLPPSADAVEQAAGERQESLRRKQEATRERVARWRSKQAAKLVTEDQSVTVTEGESVTEAQPADSCNGSSEMRNGSLATGNGSWERSVTEAASSVDRPSTVLLDRPSQPSIQRDGGIDSKCISILLEGTGAGGLPPAGLIAKWASDALYAKTERRTCPTDDDRLCFAHSLCGHDLPATLAAFYLFLNRPKGFAGLADPLSCFRRELPHHVDDARNLLAEVESDADVIAVIASLHRETFEYETEQTTSIWEFTASMLMQQAEFHEIAAMSA
jgi:hypothetical protein